MSDRSFARFLGQSASPGNDIAIPESAIEHVVWSWGQEAELAGTSDMEVRVGLADEGSYLICGRREGDGWSELEFEVTDLTGALALRLPLRNASIMTAGGLLLGEKGGYAQLGPDVLILADELVIEAETIRVIGSGVRLGAISCIANYLAKIEAGEEDLSVYIESPPPRLRQYMQELKRDQYVIPYPRYVDLRSIFGCFKPTVKGLCAHAKLVEMKVVRDSPYRAAMLKELQDAGVIFKTADRYQLDVNELGRIGFGLEDLRTGQPSDAVLAFLVRGGYGDAELGRP